MARIRRHVLARGIVQGVGFRYTVRAEAERLGLHGWVRNRADGTVEGEVEGDEDAVIRMLDWLRQGPPAARVDGLTITELDLSSGERGFDIR